MGIFKEPDHLGVKGEDLMPRHGAAEQGHPSKPFAYMRPMRRETPDFTGSTHCARRGQGLHEEKNQRAERGHQRWAGLHKDTSLQVGPIHLLRQDMHIELNHHEEPNCHVEPEVRQTPSFPHIETAIVHGDA